MIKKSLSEAERGAISFAGNGSSFCGADKDSVELKDFHSQRSQKFYQDLLKKRFQKKSDNRVNSEFNM